MDNEKRIDELAENKYQEMFGMSYEGSLFR